MLCVFFSECGGDDDTMDSSMNSTPYDSSQFSSSIPCTSDTATDSTSNISSLMSRSGNGQQQTEPHPHTEPRPSPSLPSVESKSWVIIELGVVIIC